MEWFRIYKDCLVNLFIFMTLDLFLNSFSVCRKKEQQLPVKISYLFIIAIISYLPSIPRYTLIMLLFDLSYTLLICKGNFRQRFIIYIKYELYYCIGSTIIAILYTILTLDMYIWQTNAVYAAYTSIIGNFMLYIILSMYIILKKLSDYPSGKIYKRYFLVITGLCVLLLIICSMLLGSTIIDEENVLPLLFSVLLMITLLCISIYKKVISVLQENALTKIEIEKNALEQNYYNHIQEGLKNLSLLRHDFKNHLIVLQGYAASGRIEELQNYISRLSDELTPASLIATPSQLLSAILNTKNEECKQKGVILVFEQHVSGIYIDDFHMITIFSNLLDNAITAAAKCENGTVHLKLTSLDSYLEIDCKNNHREQIIHKGDNFLSTKPTHQNIHGFGIQSMRKAVRELYGEIHIDYTENSFHVNILVPNYL